MTLERAKAIHVLALSPTVRNPERVLTTAKPWLVSRIRCPRCSQSVVSHCHAQTSVKEVPFITMYCKRVRKTASQIRRAQRRNTPSHLSLQQS